MKLQLVAKNLKKIEGGPFGDMKKFPKNFFNEIFEQCHSAEKCKRGALCDFLTSIVLQNIEPNEWGTLWCNPKTSRKVLKKVGLRCVFEVVDVCFVFSFRFGRASEVGVVEV